MKILVVGAGSIGRRHIGNLFALGRDLSVTVVEPSEMGRAAVTAAFDIDVFPSVEAALDAGRWDAAFVCSPNHMHILHARLLAAAGSHLFVEKPLSLDRDEALELAPVLDRTGVSLMVGCNLRFHPGVQSLSKALSDGAIGRPLFARAQFAHYLPNWRPAQDYRATYSARKSEGGGILLDDIHEPDYLCWLLGRAHQVSGMLATIGDLEMDVEDVADYVLWHGEHLYSHIHADYLRRDKARGCELVGTEGTVVWSSRGKNPEQVAVSLFRASTGAWELMVDEPAYDINRQYVDEARYFLDCVASGVQPMNGLGEATHVISVLDRVREAAALGRSLNMTEGMT
jgi:predicted dehydrogenase